MAARPAILHGRRPILSSPFDLLKLFFLARGRVDGEHEPHGVLKRHAIPPGRYDVGYSGNSALCQEGSAPALPCNDGPVLRNVELASDGVIDVNLPAVTVQGTVDVNGKAMHSATGERGNLEFSLKDGAKYSASSFGSSGAATYQVTLIAGTYTVVWNGSPSLCRSGSVSPVPCNSGPILKDVALTSAGVLDVNVPAIKVQGLVRVNGQAMPPAAGDRGNLELALETYFLDHIEHYAKLVE